MMDAEDAEDAKDDPTVSVFLTVPDVARALAFYTEAFGAEELSRVTLPDGSAPHAEFRIGNTVIMISPPYPEWNAGPVPTGGSSSSLLRILTPDSDASFQRAVRAGAAAVAVPKNQFWGARCGIVQDPFGFRWSLATVTENLSPGQLQGRIDDFMARGGKTDSFGEETGNPEGPVTK